MKNIITTQDPFKNTVTCTTDQWNNHVVLHNIMVSNKNAVIDTIKNPDIVHKAKDYDERLVYFKKSSFSTYKLYTKVVVSYNFPGEGEVVTAFPTKEIKGGIGDVIFTK